VPADASHPQQYEGVADEICGEQELTDRGAVGGGVLLGEDQEYEQRDGEVDDEPCLVARGGAVGFDLAAHLDPLEDALGEILERGGEAGSAELGLAEKVHHEHVRGLIVEVVGKRLQRRGGGPPGVDARDELRDLRADRFGAAAQRCGDGAFEAGAGECL